MNLQDITIDGTDASNTIKTTSILINENEAKFLAALLGAADPTLIDLFAKEHTRLNNIMFSIYCKMNDDRNKDIENEYEKKIKGE